MNGTNQVLTRGNDVNLIGDHIRRRERKAGVLLNVYNDIGLAATYMKVGLHRDVTGNKHLMENSSSSEKLKILK